MGEAVDFDARDEREVMNRLHVYAGLDRTVGVIHPARQAAVERLRAKGLVTDSWGVGADAGVMLVRQPPTGRPRSPYPRGPWDGYRA